MSSACLCLSNFSIGNQEFFKDEETRSNPEPMECDRDVDPDFEPCSASEGETGNDEESEQWEKVPEKDSANPGVHKERKFLIFESCLFNLFDMIRCVMCMLRTKYINFSHDLMSIADAPPVHRT
jgi:hypothetical protein